MMGQSAFRTAGPDARGAVAGAGGGGRVGADAAAGARRGARRAPWAAPAPAGWRARACGGVPAAWWAGCAAPAAAAPAPAQPARAPALAPGSTGT